MQSLSSALPSALAQLLRETPLSEGKARFAWKAVVGPALEKVTSVRLEGSRLLVDAATPQWAREIRHSTHVILPRLEGLLGKGAVTRIEVRHLP